MLDVHDDQSESRSDTDNPLANWQWPESRFEVQMERKGRDWCQSLATRHRTSHRTNSSAQATWRAGLACPAERSLCGPNWASFLPSVSVGFGSFDVQRLPHGWQPEATSILVALAEVRERRVPYFPTFTLST